VVVDQDLLGPVKAGRTAPRQELASIDRYRNQKVGVRAVGAAWMASGVCEVFDNLSITG